MDITSQDIALIGFLAFLEGILSIDNALVLAMMARHLPPALQKRALTYGLVGAVVFRIIALGLVTQLMQWTWVKFVGGGYLIIVSLSHFLKKSEEDPNKPAKVRGFWATVAMIELMDIAFAVDSILAAVAVSNKFWIVFTGGFIGVIMMRFAATVFLKLLARFPSFETAAYLLVLTIGVKLVVDGFKFRGFDFHSSESPAFWVFWSTMALCVAYGFMPKRKSKRHS
jgi:YkoY family integral membrane protein